MMISHPPGSRPQGPATWTLRRGLTVEPDAHAADVVVVLVRVFVVVVVVRVVLVPGGALPAVLLSVPSVRMVASVVVVVRVVLVPGGALRAAVVAVPVLCVLVAVLLLQLLIKGEATQRTDGNVRREPGPPARQAKSALSPNLWEPSRTHTPPTPARSPCPLCQVAALHATRCKRCRAELT